MRVAPRHHRAADEHHPHQPIARDLFGPGQAVIEHIAREELQKDDEGEAPEDHEREPVLRVMLDDDLFVLGDDEVDVVVGFAADFFVPRSAMSSRPSFRRWRSLFRPSTASRFYQRRRGCPCTRPAMTLRATDLFQSLQRVVFGLRPAGTRAGVVMQRQRRLAESFAVDFYHGLAELTEFVGELQLGSTNLVGRLRGSPRSTPPQTPSCRRRRASARHGRRRW